MAIDKKRGKRDPTQGTEILEWKVARWLICF